MAQGVASWYRDRLAELQSVVLYSLLAGCGQPNFHNQRVDKNGASSYRMFCTLDPAEADYILVQDMASWSRDGVAGLQSVVLYSLPELDGAIDTVPLGGLVGDGIFLSLERVRKLASRIKAWVALRRTPPQVTPLHLQQPPGPHAQVV